MIIVEPASNGRRRINKAALTKFLLQAQAAVGLPGEVNVLLAGNNTLHRLNFDFRKKNKPTDVLSFPAPEVRPAQSASGGKREPWLGDLAISVEIARENAGRFGHALEMELKVLLLHGLLHLAGYDHETDNGRMARKERALQKKLGLKAALIERTSEPTAESGSSRRARRQKGRKRLHQAPPNQARLNQARLNHGAQAKTARNHTPQTEALHNQALRDQALAN